MRSFKSVNAIVHALMRAAGTPYGLSDGVAAIASGALKRRLTDPYGGGEVRGCQYP
jgi:hypothetical protein